jgi:hypothetical protein
MPVDEVKEIACLLEVVAHCEAGLASADDQNIHIAIDYRYLLVRSAREGVSRLPVPDARLGAVPSIIHVAMFDVASFYLVWVNRHHPSRVICEGDGGVKQVR